MKSFGAEEGEQAEREGGLGEDLISLELAADSLAIECNCGCAAEFEEEFEEIELVCGSCAEDGEELSPPTIDLSYDHEGRQFDGPKHTYSASQGGDDAWGPWKDEDPWKSEVANERTGPAATTAVRATETNTRTPLPDPLDHPWAMYHSVYTPPSQEAVSPTTSVEQFHTQTEDIRKKHPEQKDSTT